MELHKENSRGITADDVLDAQKAIMYEHLPLELRGLTPDGRCMHCGAEQSVQVDT